MAALELDATELPDFFIPEREPELLIADWLRKCQVEREKGHRHDTTEQMQVVATMIVKGEAEGKDKAEDKGDSKAEDKGEDKGDDKGHDQAPDMVPNLTADEGVAEGADL